MNNGIYGLVLIATLLTALVAGCGRPSVSQDPAKTAAPAAPPPVLGEVGEDSVVVKARALIEVSTESPTTSARLFNLLLAPAYAATSGNQGISVVNAASTNMTISNSAWSVPAITNALLDFGFLDVASLFDNNLKVCGAGGTTKCGTALFRMYTTGVAGAGVWNAADSYGAPITANLPSASPGSVGLSVSEAAVLQTYTIPTSKKVLRLTDFTPSPHFNVKSDFNDAGSGSYSTTIVLEYGLTL